MKTKNFKFGEKTTNIYSGDIVSTCEFVADLGKGRLLFWDVTFKCFRRTKVRRGDGELYLDGWDCESRPSKFV